MNIENIRKKIDFSEDNIAYFGPFAKNAKTNITNPGITFFRQRRQQNITNFICFPTVIVNKYNVKLDEKYGDLANELVISLNTKDEFDELKEIIIKINYGTVEVINYSLSDILNIYKMFPKYYNNKFTHMQHNKRTYNININTLLNLQFFKLEKKINIEIIGINNTNIQSEVFFDSYILTKLEIGRFETAPFEDEIYQYKIIECKNNEESKISLSNNTIIDKLLVCGDYTHNVVFKDEEIEMNLINNNSEYNKYHKLCGEGDNAFFYFCNNPTNIDDKNRYYSGKNFPSITKSITIEGFKGLTSTLYVQYCNYLIIAEDVKFAY